MPGGISDPVGGYFTFCAVKFAGYSLAGRLLSGTYQRADRNPFLVGGVRTLIGMAAGAAVFGVFRLLSNPGNIAFIASLVPIRIAEWWLLLWLFYDRPLQQRARDWRCVAAGTAWSYFLDVPALIGFVFTAGVWVC